MLDIEQYSDVTVDEWNKVGNAQVYYASKKSLTLPRLVRLLKTPHDLLYVNSFLTLFLRGYRCWRAISALHPLSYLSYHQGDSFHKVLWF